MCNSILYWQGYQEIGLLYIVDESISWYEYVRTNAYKFWFSIPISTNLSYDKFVKC